MIYKSLIYLRNKDVSLYDCSSEAIKLLKKDGEKSHDFKESEFWSWWRKKFNYNNEKVAFFIITDEDNFEVPSDINLTEKAIWNIEKIKEIAGVDLDSLKTITYPKFDIESIPIISNPSKEKAVKKAKKGSIAEYFQSKTEVIKKY